MTNIDKLKTELEKLINTHPSTALHSFEALGPGLGCEQIGRTLRDAELVSLGTLETLFSTLDGVNRVKGWRIDEILLFLQYYPLPLEEAIRLRDDFMFEQSKAFDLAFWENDWLPFAADGFGGHLFFDLSIEPDEVFLSSNDFFRVKKVAPSLLAYVKFNVAAIQLGLMSKSEQGYFELNDAKYFALGAKHFSELEYWSMMDNAYRV